MLSYQHAYHAGNFADVHKHLTLSRVLDYLTRKPAPLCYLDTHAGRADYDLQCSEAQKTGEAQQGLWRIDPATAPALTAPYLDAIRRANPAGGRRFYPGSPRLAMDITRSQDRLVLCEMHPRESNALREAFFEARVQIHVRDGHEALPALVPPQEKRGVVLIDPSYEVKEEYHRVFETVSAAHRKWANGCYLIWYPLLPAEHHAYLLKKLARAGIPRILRSELTVQARQGAHGMYGSGMLIINPPWTLAEELESLGQWLAHTLPRDNAGHHSVDWWVGDDQK